MNISKKSSIFHYISIVLGVVAFGAVTLTSPITDSRFDIFASRHRLIQPSFVVPVAIIWYEGFCGAIKFQSYTNKLKTSVDLA